jgi:biopolymer transport protein ExbD
MAGSSYVAALICVVTFLVGQMVTRAERVILLAADSRVPYGDVVTFASTLQRDTPDLHISLVTRSSVTDPL